MKSGNKTSSRKDDHIRICIERDVSSGRSNGFERYELEHNALPETRLSAIETSTDFLGKAFRLPLFIEAMTGGSPGTEKININLAIAAERMGIGMGVGSQRAMLENPELAYTYAVRDVAPSIFLLGNIGAVQLPMYSAKELSGVVRDIGADGLAVHLNAAQELAQPEGDSDWSSVVESLKKLCRKVDFPVVVKETGCGISGDVARKLESSGVSAIDTAGAGGTSWTRVEYYRGSDIARAFVDWGIPTAESLVQCRKAVKMPIIASGGIRTGIDVAKSLAMGASLAGLALPLLRPATQSPNAVMGVLGRIAGELKAAMMLVGARKINDLARAKISPIKK